MPIVGGVTIGGQPETFSMRQALEKGCPFQTMVLFILYSHCCRKFASGKKWLFFFLMDTWICCVGIFFTLYDGRSPLNHNLGEYAWNFFQEPNSRKSKYTNRSQPNKTLTTGVSINHSKLHQRFTFNLPSLHGIHVYISKDPGMSYGWGWDSDLSPPILLNREVFGFLGFCIFT